MQKLTYVVSIVSIVFTACQTEIEKQDTSEATIASETGMPPALPADVLSITKPLINGELYSKPDFGSTTLAHFDTAQQIQLLDTTGAMFLKARIDKNAGTFTGYISKAIVPEQL